MATAEQDHYKGKIPQARIDDLASTHEDNHSEKETKDHSIHDDHSISSRQDSGSATAGSQWPPNPSDNQSPPQQQQTIVSFSPGDPTNPYNWSRMKKLYVLIVCIVLVLNSTLGSSLPTGAIREIQTAFDLTSSAQLVLPVSIYLVGYVLGPLVFAPMSESFGRKWVLVGTFVVFTAFQLGTALANNFATLIVMRLFCGVGASTPISVVGGALADVYVTSEARGRAVTVFMAATVWGPLVGPVVSGFIAVVSWRWAFWLGLIVAGITWPFVLLMPETYGPAILRTKARKLRKETGDSNIVAPIELVETDWHEFVVVTLTRPVRMFLFEWIVLFSCLYLALVYAIFYMYLQAYPIIFEQIYGFNAGEEGLTFLPIGIGAVIAVGIYLWWEHYLNQAKARQEVWAQNPDYVRLPIACLGAPLFAISLFWLGWTAYRSVPWIVPVLSAIPFGIGYLLAFQSLVNYQVDSYEIYAASALAASSCSRSAFGVVLPFATQPMFDSLGVHWACSLLGFLSLAMGVVPFLFVKYGATLRERSEWCQELARLKAERAAAEEEEREKTGPQLTVVEDPEKQV